MRENSTLENFKNIRATEKLLAEAEAAKVAKKEAIREEWLNNYHIKLDMKARTESDHMRLMEAARDQALSSIIKAIYITALEAETLTDEGLILAENMVDNWIKERGGASKILSSVEENTYLLNRIACIVEDTAEATVEEIEKDELDSDKKDEAESKAKEFIDTADKEEIKDFMNNLIDKIQDKAEDEGEKKESEEKAEESEEKSEESKEEEPAEAEEVVADLDMNEEPAEEAPAESEDEKSESSEEEKKEEDDDDDDEEDKAEDKESEESDDDDDSDKDNSDVKDEDKDDDDDDEEDDDDDEKEEEKSEAETSEEAPEGLEVEDTDGDGDISSEEIESDTEEDLGEPLDDDEVGADTNLDGEIEDNSNDAESKMFDELEDEEDVQKAIEIIRTRVADAEETFIRNNAEDKKKMDEILTKISNNVKTVEDLDSKDKKDENAIKNAQESAMYYKGKMNDVKFNRDLTIFERMSRILTENIVKNDNIKDMYLTEAGQLDVGLVVESAKIMYAFLETLNTIQIENVDEKYISKVLNDMKNE